MQRIHRSLGKQCSVFWLVGCLFFAAVILTTGCVGNRRQLDYAKLYRVVPGEEREDFGRIASWIAERDGQITLTVGGTIHWAETVYYRWYSNETFVITTCPPRFHETRSEIRWLCGSVMPVKRGVGWAMTDDYGLRGPGTYDFSEAQMRPENAHRDGVFGVRFGDRRERLLEVLAWHITDQPDDFRNSEIIIAKKMDFDSFDFVRLRDYPGIQLFCYLSKEREVGIFVVRMPDSPGLAGLDFMGEDPPVLRQGSFIVDEELAAKGRNRRLSPKKPAIAP